MSEDDAEIRDDDDTRAYHVEHYDENGAEDAEEDADAEFALS